MLEPVSVLKHKQIPEEIGQSNQNDNHAKLQGI